MAVKKSDDAIGELLAHYHRLHDSKYFVLVNRGATRVELATELLANASWDATKVPDDLRRRVEFALMLERTRAAFSRTADVALSQAKKTLPGIVAAAMAERVAEVPRHPVRMQSQQPVRQLIQPSTPRMLSSAEVAALSMGELRKRATYTGVCYDGGIVKQPFGADGKLMRVVIDIAGMTFETNEAGRLPSLREHSYKRPVGSHLMRATDTALHVYGGSFLMNADADEVLSGTVVQHPWEMSVRGPFFQATLVSANSQARVNGRTIQGPFLLVRNMRLTEVSFVTKGANVNRGTKVVVEVPVAA